MQLLNLYAHEKGKDMKRLICILTAVLLLVAVLAPPPARAGTLLVADSGSGNGQVEEYDASSGALITHTFIQTVPLGGGSPAGMVLDSVNNHLFFNSDMGGNNTVSEYNATTGALMALNFVPAHLSSNLSPAVGGGHLFVGVDHSEWCGECSYNAISGASAGSIDFGGGVYGMTVDSSGHLFVDADIAGNVTVREYDASTAALITSNFISTGPFLGNAASMLVDNSGNLFVAPNSTLSTVSEYNSSGAFIRNLGSTVAPWGLALDDSGNLFISYASNFVEKDNALTGAVINANFILPTGLNSAGLVFLPVPEPGSMILALPARRGWPSVSGDRQEAVLWETLKGVLHSALLDWV